MASEIRMPQLGVSMDTGTVTRWHKQVGDPVKNGEVLVSIETEKLTSDIPAESDGVLLAILAEVGDELPIRGLLGIVGQPGESWNVPEDKKAKDAPAAAVAAPANAQTVAKSAEPRCSGRLKASPLARKVAAKLGIDLTLVQPGGASGRIREADVRAYAAERTVAPASAHISRGTRRERMTGMRKAVSQNMRASLQTNAQTVMRTDVDMSPSMDIRASFKDNEQKISYNDILVYCVSRALKQMPVVNASIDGTDILYHDYVNVGLAVSVSGGLIVPVVRDADQMSLWEIHNVLTDLVDRARQGTLTDQDYHGGTFTVSSLGTFDVDSFTAIINPPESAILGVGRIKKIPVVNENDEIAVRPMCNLSLSYDHRLIDGAEAAKFLQLIKRYLQQPLLLL